MSDLFESKIKDFVEEEHPELEAEVRRISETYGREIMRSMSSYVKAGSAEVAQAYFRRLAELRAKAEAFPAKADHYRDMIRDVETEIMLAEADIQIIRDYARVEGRNAFIEYLRVLVEKVGPVARDVALAYAKGAL